MCKRGHRVHSRRDGEHMTEFDYDRMIKVRKCE